MKKWSEHSWLTTMNIKMGFDWICANKYEGLLKLQYANEEQKDFRLNSLLVVTNFYWTGRPKGRGQWSKVTLPTIFILQKIPESSEGPTRRTDTAS